MNLAGWFATLGPLAAAAALLFSLRCRVWW